LDQVGGEHGLHFARAACILIGKQKILPTDKRNALGAEFPFLCAGWCDISRVANTAMSAEENAQKDAIESISWKLSDFLYFRLLGLPSLRSLNEQTLDSHSRNDARSQLYECRSEFYYYMKWNRNLIA
jgi:hypothetical protein